MLVGYVSNERYVALPDVLLEFENERGSVEARSRASGAIHADVEPGSYRVTLSKPGFGAKRLQMTVGPGHSVPVSTALRLPAGLCLAQMCARGRNGRVSRPLPRGLPNRIVALRTPEGTSPRFGLVRRTWAARHRPNHP